MDVGVSCLNRLFYVRNLLVYFKRTKEKPQETWYFCRESKGATSECNAKQYRSGNCAGIERNNNKATVIEVLTFRNSWLGASGIAGCNISLIQFLSLIDDDFLKTKHFFNLEPRVLSFK